ncbi:MAG: hypothetical protein HQM04_00745 [Magnetococcales bacterium]|nr:hypothetical protein [Magnetococcales bacterium]MBF0113548.1 hypothetical protein [Magnetococcales bacterium]
MGDTARLRVDSPAKGKTHWEDVRIGAEKRANPHILRQLGALRRRKKRVGLS